MAEKNNLAQSMTEGCSLIDRVFDAPVDLVWQCWTEQAHLDKWSAPRGYTVPAFARAIAPRRQMALLHARTDGSELWLGGDYREIVPNRLLVMTHAWERGGGPGTETVVTVRFEDLGGQHRVTLEQTGFDSDESRDGHEAVGASASIMLAEHLAT